MATKQHNLMSGADLHPNAIDGTTGTELPPASQTTYDGRWVKGKVSAATTTDTFANTTTVTKFAQKYTLSANTLAAGKVVRVTARGYYSTLGASPGNWEFRLYAGSTILLDTGSNSLTAGLTNVGWTFTGELTCIATGASGSVEVAGRCIISTSTGATSNIDLHNTTTKIVDTTVSQDIQAAWGFITVADPANTITCRQFIVEVLG